MFRLTTVFLVLLLVLSGCAGKDMEKNYFDSINDSNTKKMEIVSDYFLSRDKMSSLVMSSFSGTAEGTLAMVMYSMLSQQQDIAFLKQFAPAVAEKFTSNADIGLAFVKDTLPSAFKIGGMVYLGGKIVDGFAENAGDRYDLSGSGDTNFFSIEGSGNSMRGDELNFDLDIPMLEE